MHSKNNEQQQHEEEEEKGVLTSSNELRELFDKTFLGQNEIVFAFGYGSGVFVQQDTQQKKKEKPSERKMLDMILIVNDARKFHGTNLKLNPDHYAPLFRDASRATWWQKHELNNIPFLHNPKVFFNFSEDPFMKYGIMEMTDLSSDLEHWDSLYIGGRMHKPTAIITARGQEGEEIFRLQNEHNLPAALSTALLLSRKNIDDRSQKNGINISFAELYSLVSSLSYTGDFRMQLGAEDPGKINKLVNSPGQLQRFHNLYNQSTLQPLEQKGLITLDSSKKMLTWNPNDPSAIDDLWRQLPRRMQVNVPSNKDDAFLYLQQALHKIVAPAARYQSFKGLWTAGLSKSARYAAAKFAKGIFGRK